MLLVKAYKRKMDKFGKLQHLSFTFVVLESFPESLFGHYDWTGPIIQNNSTSGCRDNIWQAVRPFAFVQMNCIFFTAQHVNARV